MDRNVASVVIGAAGGTYLSLLFVASSLAYRIVETNTLLRHLNPSASLDASVVPSPDFSKYSGLRLSDSASADYSAV